MLCRNPRFGLQRACKVGLTGLSHVWCHAQPGDSSFTTDKAVQEGPLHCLGMGLRGIYQMLLRWLFRYRMFHQFVYLGWPRFCIMLPCCCLSLLKSNLPYQKWVDSKIPRIKVNPIKILWSDGTSYTHHYDTNLLDNLAALLTKPNDPPLTRDIEDVVRNKNSIKFGFEKGTANEMLGRNDTPGSTMR